MTWQATLKRKVLDKDQAQRDLDRVLLEAIPRFKAPTDATAWRKRIPKLRRAALRQVYLKGWPAKWIDGGPRVVWGKTRRPHPSYRIRKLRYEAVPGYWIPALLYEPAKLRAKAPVVLNPNGHHGGGKACTYKQARCINLARRGMIALSPEFIGMGELEADRVHDSLIHFDLVGMAGVGLMYLAMRKALDLLLDHPHANRKRVCMTGLSGGGWQTIVLSALDPRVTAAVPVAGYRASREFRIAKDLGDHEQTPTDLLQVFDYPHMTAMLAPRPALIMLNDRDDCCFRTAETRPGVYDAVRPTYRAFGAIDRFQFHNNLVPGTHNYATDNRCRLYKFLNEQFNLDTPEHDLHQAGELLTYEQLAVGLPAKQKTVYQLVNERTAQVVKHHHMPVTPADRRALRRKLAKVIRLPQYTVRAGRVNRGNVKLKVGPWRIPMSVRPKPGGPVELIITDAGRASRTERRVGANRSVYVPDLLGFGENHQPVAMLRLLNTGGHRHLGILVAQTLACARFAARHGKADRIHLVADGAMVGFGTGLVTAVSSLIAAALEPRLFHSLTIAGASLASLRRLVDWPIRYDQAQPLFCFGLLEAADLPQIQALLEDVTLVRPDRFVAPVRHREKADA